MATSLGPRWPSPFVVKITRNIQEESLPIFHAERHPLGFRRYELRLFGRAIRLHYWPANCQPGEDRHTHQYPFVSVPLLGRFADTRYVEVPGDEWQKHTCQTGTKTAVASGRPVRQTAAAAVPVCLVGDPLAPSGGEGAARVAGVRGADAGQAVGRVPAGERSSGTGWAQLSGQVAGSCGKLTKGKRRGQRHDQRKPAGHGAACTKRHRVGTATP
jgi:hypothetical protein